MIVHSPTRHGKTFRYYLSSSTREGARYRERPLRVDAFVLEDMIRTQLCGFLRNRFELAGAVLQLSQEGRNIDGLLENALIAANHVAKLEHPRLRFVFEALVRRIEITRDRVRVVIGSEEILALVSWDGAGLPPRCSGPVNSRPHVHLLEFEAESVRTERAFKMPIEARDASFSYSPDPKLVALLRMARAVQAAIQEERHLSLRDIAPRFGRKPGYIARALRLNYLAPDIQTAILDGLQPPGLNSRRLIYGHIPMDWAEQRKLLGFPPHDELLRGLGNYARLRGGGAAKDSECGPETDEALDEVENRP